MASFVSWITSTITFGTMLMYGALGEILTEKSGHLNLGIPGIMMLGGFAGFISVFLYEKNTAVPSSVLLALIPLITAFAVAGLGGLLYSFLTVTLRANQNVTGLAITFFGVGVGSFGCINILQSKGVSSYAKAFAAFDVFSENINSYLNAGDFGKMFLSYGFMFYLAIIIAILMQLFLKRTRKGLNLRSVGENPATADAAGINVTRYKYLATTIGCGIAGLGGMYYFVNYGFATANTTTVEAMGWLAVALVIFATWKPANAIWGSYLFAFLYWMVSYLPGVAKITLSTADKDIVQMMPYLVTILVLIIVSFRKKKENQPPASLGLSYFREER